MKIKYIIAAAVAALMLAGIAACICISVTGMNRIQEVKNTIVEELNKEEEPEDPEYVKIAEAYEIKPTKKISDAYISGDETELDDSEKATLKAASDVIKEVVKDDMSLYEKEKALYEWVTTNISNDYEGMTADPQQLADPGTVLINKKAVCVGFATTYKLLVNMIGIECMVEHDFEKSHSWDVLKLDDGCWYICDCYMGVSSKLSNFNMNQEYALASHSFDVSQYPVANGFKYFPAFSDKQDIFKSEDILKLMAEFLDGKDEFISVGIKKTEMTRAELEYLLSGISSRVEIKNGYLDYNVSDVKIEDVEYTLAVVSKSIYNESGYELDEKTVERYDRLLTYQFGELDCDDCDYDCDGEPVG